MNSTMNFYNKSYAKIFSKNIDNSIYVKQRHFSPFKSYIIANNECKYVFGNQKGRESNELSKIKEKKKWMDQSYRRIIFTKYNFLHTNTNFINKRIIIKSFTK